AHIIFFGINSAEDYRTGDRTGTPDGVMVDSPAQAKSWQ
ncbi:glycerophosphodiester phosphodiesterase, partial [Klebsiella pneumoniae]